MQGNRNELSHPSPVSLQTMYCQASRSSRILDLLQCCTSSAEGMAAAPLLCMPHADPAVFPTRLYAQSGAAAVPDSICRFCRLLHCTAPCSKIGPAVGHCGLLCLNNQHPSDGMVQVRCSGLPPQKPPRPADQMRSPSAAAAAAQTLSCAKRHCCCATSWQVGHPGACEGCCCCHQRLDDLCHCLTGTVSTSVCVRADADLWP